MKQRTPSPTSSRRSPGTITSSAGSAARGQVGKSANNLIHWAEIVAVDEAMRLAADLGVNPAALRDALQHGPTDRWTLREIEQMRFTWYARDIKVADELAAGVGRDLPVARLCRERMSRITVASVHELLGIP